jgi:hypothetical protein
LRCARRFDQLSSEGKIGWCQRHTHHGHALTCQGDRHRTGSPSKGNIGNVQLGLPVAGGGRRKRYLDLAATSHGNTSGAIVRLAKIVGVGTTDLNAGEV